LQAAKYRHCEFYSALLGNSILYIIEQDWGKKQTDELLKMAGKSRAALT
jgi:hypothetical protein